MVNIIIYSSNTVHVDQCLYSVYRINRILLLWRVIITVVCVITYHRTFALTDDKNNLTAYRFWSLSLHVFSRLSLWFFVSAGRLYYIYCTRRQTAIEKIVDRCRRDQPTTIILYIDFPTFLYLLFWTTTDDATSWKSVTSTALTRRFALRRAILWRLCVSVVQQTAAHLIVVFSWP